MSKTPLRVGYITGSGTVLDLATNATVTDTRIHGIQASGVGTFLITGTSTDSYTTVKGNNIKFILTTNNDTLYMMYPDLGVRMEGIVKVSAPTSAATTTI